MRRYAVAGTVTLVSAVVFAVFLMVTPDPWGAPHVWLAALVSIGGQVAWLIQLSRAPPPESVDALVWRLVTITLLMAPTVPLALYMVVILAVVGDNTWMGAYMAVPGLIAAPFGVLAYWRIFTPRRSPRVG